MKIISRRLYLISEDGGRASLHLSIGSPIYLCAIESELVLSEKPEPDCPVVAVCMCGLRGSYLIGDVHEGVSTSGAIRAEKVANGYPISLGLKRYTLHVRTSVNLAIMFAMTGCIAAIFLGFMVMRGAYTPDLPSGHLDAPVQSNVRFPDYHFSDGDMSEKQAEMKLLVKLDDDPDADGMLVKTEDEHSPTMAKEGDAYRIFEEGRRLFESGDHGGSVERFREAKMAARKLPVKPGFMSSIDMFEQRAVEMVSKKYRSKLLLAKSFLKEAESVDMENAVGLLRDADVLLREVLDVDDRNEEARELAVGLESFEKKLAKRFLSRARLMEDLRGCGAALGGYRRVVELFEKRLGGIVSKAKASLIRCEGRRPG